MANVSQFDFPPALPREGWAGSVSPENDKPALFDFPAGQRQQGIASVQRVGLPTSQGLEATVSEGCLPQGYGTTQPRTGHTRAMDVAATLANDFPAASPHYTPQAGTAGPARTPAQGGGQLQVMPCGGVDSDTPGRTNSPTAGYSAVNGEESVSGNDCAIRTGTSPVMNSASRVQFPARMAPDWRFLCQ